MTSFPTSPTHGRSTGSWPGLAGPARLLLAFLLSLGIWSGLGFSLSLAAPLQDQQLITVPIILNLNQFSVFNSE